MKTIKAIYMIVSLSIMLQACGKEQQHTTTHQQLQPVRITKAIAEAVDPYLTQDQEGNPVLCWTEKVSEEKGYVLRYSVYDADAHHFGAPITVEPSLGTRAHAESMNKVGFKSDGTIIALYAVKHPTEENPFAGSILYTMSKDHGKSWSPAAYLHSDTLKTYGRSFFDLTILPDGEVGAVWLDGRLGRDAIGSALFFAKTESGKGFGMDQQIGESTCECCRTDIYVDHQERIHVAYRDILLSSAVVGEQVRDIAHVVSMDSGKIFSQAQRVSADNWAVDGCPHTGPALAADAQGLHAVWFTAGGQPGVYYAFSKDEDSTFTHRQMLSKLGRHPQMMALSDQSMVIAWQESNTGVYLVDSHPSGHNHQEEKGNTVIKLQKLNKHKSSEKALQLSEDNQAASYPVVALTKANHVLVAWVQQDHDHSAIYYTLSNN